MAAGRQYRLIRELGTGTFGTVYQAELQAMGDFRKDVALKVLHPQWERHGDAAGRFRDEARLLGQLRHRHIVGVDGLVRVGGRWAVVMEYIAGVDAHRMIQTCRKLREPYPVPGALEVCAAVASALDAAYHFQPEGHDKLQVIHRDIKPSNVRLTVDGDVKVLDFGIARADFKGREVITESVRYGSVRYMAPERRSSAQDTAAGDVYGLGCVLYEILVGRPFGNAKTRFAEHTAKVRRALLKVEERVGPVGTPVVELLEGMLQFEARLRPTAEQVAETCRTLARALPGEDQTTFARRMVPRVKEVLGDPSVAVDRTVSADPGSLETPPLDSSSQPVLREETIAPSPERRVTPDEAANRRRVLLPVTAAAAVIAFSLALQAVQASTTEGPAYLASQRVLSSASTWRPVPRPPRAELPPAGDDVADEPAAATTEPATTEPATTEPATTEPDTTEPDTTEPDTTEPDTTEPPPPAAEPPPAPGVGRFVVPGADAVTADCTGASASGTDRVDVRGAREGPCTVTIQRGERTWTTELPLGYWRCSVHDGSLVCR